MVKKPCGICDKPLAVTWTDTHGVAQCLECGAPYRIFHYEGDGDERKRVEKPPEILIGDGMKDEFRRCWKETGAKLSAVGFRLSFPGGYDIASRDDQHTVMDWFNRPKSEERPEEGR